MGRNLGPSCKQCRREGERLFLKGDRCNSQKCSVARNNTRPGQHGAVQKKVSDYAVRLREKQKLRRIFGISEGQLRNYFERARKSQGITGLMLLQMLECRLDNIVFRLGLAPSRKAARQLVKHTHFLVNGQRVDIPSYQAKPGDVITIKERSQKTLEGMIQKAREVNYPAWVSFNPDKKEGSVNALPSREEIDYPISEQLIVEYYAR
jgi:small subunit ribosomal protein S4